MILLKITKSTEEINLKKNIRSFCHEFNTFSRVISRLHRYYVHKHSE